MLSIGKNNMCYGTQKFDGSHDCKSLRIIIIIQEYTSVLKCRKI